MEKRNWVFSHIIRFVFANMVVWFGLIKLSAQYSTELLKNVKFLFIITMVVSFVVYLILRVVRLTIVAEEWADGRRSRGLPSLRKMSLTAFEISITSGFWIYITHYLINHP